MLAYLDGPLGTSQACIQVGESIVVLVVVERGGHGVGVVAACLRCEGGRRVRAGASRHDGKVSPVLASSIPQWTDQ